MAATSFACGGRDPRTAARVSAGACSRSGLAEAGDLVFVVALSPPAGASCVCGSTSSCWPQQHEATNRPAQNGFFDANLPAFGANPRYRPVGLNSYRAPRGDARRLGYGGAGGSWAGWARRLAKGRRRKPLRATRTNALGDNELLNAEKKRKEARDHECTL